MEENFGAGRCVTGSKGVSVVVSHLHIFFVVVVVGVFGVVVGLPEMYISK